MATPSDQGAPGSGPKVTASEIARDWGCTRQYVSKLIRENGCPTDSLASAREWRIANAKYGIGYRSSGRKPESPAESTSPAPARPPSPEAPPPPVAESAPRDLSTVEASLLGAIAVEQQALRLVELAQTAKNDALISVRIQAYNRAQANRLEAEERVRDFLEKQNRLVPWDLVIGIIRRAWIPHINRLRALPKRAAIKANPADDRHAESVLAEEIEAVIAETRLEYDLTPAA